MFGAPVYNQFMPLNAFPQVPNNAKIPMIGDKPQNLPPESRRSASPDIPPTPHPGLPSTGGLNWNIVASCSPEEIAKTNDIKTIEALLNSFLNSRFTNTEAQLLPNPLAAKFYRLLQIGVQYIYDTQEHLREIVRQSDASNKELKEKLRTLTSAVAHLKNKVGKKTGEGSEKCVVCHRVFKSLEYLDSHMQRRHAALVPAWKSLRSGTPQGLEDITDQITHLRQAISKTRAELSHAVADHADVHHIVEQPDMQLRALVELNEKQDRLIEQQNNQERAQMNFRREVRNQLDSAIVQLRQSARRIEEKASRPQMPPMPPPDFIKHELEMSLTQQLVMKQQLSPERVRTSIESLDVLRPPMFPSSLKVVPVPQQQQQQQQSPPKQKPQERVSFENIPKQEESMPKFVELPKQEFVKNPVQVDKSSSSKPAKKAPREEFNFETGVDEPPVIPHIADGEVPFAIPPQVLSPQVPPVNDEVSDSEMPSSRPVTGDTVFSMLEPIEKTPAKINGVKRDLIERAKQCLAKPPPGQMSKSQREKYTSGLLMEVTETLDKLRQMRPYAPPTDVYASKVLNNGKKGYISMHDELLMMIEKESPVSDPRKASLFANRQMTFPMQAPKKKPVLSKEMQKKMQTDIGFQMLAEGSPSKVPQATHRKVTRGRDLLEPDSSDIIQVSNIETSETSSGPVPGIFEDPYYYGKPKKEKVYTPITRVSTSSSSAIKPVSSDEDDGLQEFAMSNSEDEKEKKPTDAFFARDSVSSVSSKSSAKKSTKDKRSSVSSVSSRSSKSTKSTKSNKSEKKEEENDETASNLRRSNTAMMTDSSSSSSTSSRKNTGSMQRTETTTTTVSVTKANTMQQKVDDKSEIEDVSSSSDDF